MSASAEVVSAAESPTRRARAAALANLAGLVPSLPFWLLGAAIMGGQVGLSPAVGALPRLFADVLWLEKLEGRAAPSGAARATFEALGPALMVALVLTFGLLPFGLGTLWGLAALGPWLPVVVLERRGLARTAALTSGRRGLVLATWLPTVALAWTLPVLVGQFLGELGLSSALVSGAIASTQALAWAAQAAVSWALWRVLTERP